MKERALPEGWVWKRLGEIVDNFDNKRIPLKSEDRQKRKGIYPYCGANGIIDYIDDFLYDGDFVLLAEDGGYWGAGENSAYLMTGKFWVNNHAHILQAKKNLTENAFLVKILNYLDLNKFISGTTRGKLTQGIMNNIEIPLPSLHIQRQIVAVLEQAEALKRQRQEADALTGALLQSVFFEMFGDPVRNEREWNIAKIEEICDEITVGIVVRPASYYVESGVPAFRSLNIRPDKLNLENFVYINSSDNDTVLAKSKIRDGDVLVVRTGYPGTACVVPPEFDGANCIDLIILRPKKQIVNCNYLSRFLNSEYGKAQALAGNTGLAQQHLNIGAIRQVKIPLPPLALQQQFAQVVEGVERIREQQTESKREIDTMFEGLMAGAFSSKIEG